MRGCGKTWILNFQLHFYKGIPRGSSCLCWSAVVIPCVFAHLRWGYDASALQKVMCRPHHLTLHVFFSGDIYTAGWWLGGMWSDWSCWWCFCMFFMLVAWGRAGMCMARTVKKMFGVLDFPLETDGSNSLGLQWGPNRKSSPCASCSTVWPEKLAEMDSGWLSADLNCCYISVNFRRSSSWRCVIATESKDGQPNRVNQ